MKKIVLASAFAFLASCASQNTTTPSSFDWKGANVYFAVTDRFNNGNPDNDVNFNRTEKAAVLRGFEGGDIRGVIQKIDVIVRISIIESIGHCEIYIGSFPIKR